MALVLDEDEENGGSGTNLAPQTVGGAGYVGGGSPSSQPNTSVQQGASHAQTPQFNNIMGYIDPSDSTQSNQLGSAVSGDISSKGDLANSSISQWTSDANKEIAAGTPTFNQQTANSWLTTPDQSLVDQSRSTGIAASISAPTNPAWSSWSNPGYTGPANSAAVTSSADPASAVQTANDKINSLNTPGGMSAEMTNLYGGGGNYTPGMAGLDAAILGSGQGAQNVANTNAQYGNLNDLWNSAQSNASGNAHLASQQADTVQGEWTNAEKAANQSYADANAAYQNAAIAGKAAKPGLSIKTAPGQQSRPNVQASIGPTTAPTGVSNTPMGFLNNLGPAFKNAALEGVQTFTTDAPGWGTDLSKAYGNLNSLWS